MQSTPPEIDQIIQKFHSDPTELVGILREIQKAFRHIGQEHIDWVAKSLGLTSLHVAGTASFYHFFSPTPVGKYAVYFNTSATAEMAGMNEIIAQFESLLGIACGEVREDGVVSLHKTSCIGMSDLEPALLINSRLYPRVTPERAVELCKQIESDQLLAPPPVPSQIRLRGEILLTSHKKFGIGLQRAMAMTSLDVIEAVKHSGLRGRGGAGFSAGQKWGFCRAAEAEERIVICNADEGEPGTFKDRILLSDYAELVFEGMAVAAYALEAKRGYLYLRGEYEYLKEALEAILAKLRNENLLGNQILGSDFTFDIQIKMGAGAYICGEESALIESAEGKRGQPRNRPPFPVTSGYLRKPTVVNNCETLASVTRIFQYPGQYPGQYSGQHTGEQDPLEGAKWFKSFGTSASAGTKLLSIAGDCELPGVYEVPWGISVKEVLALCKAVDPFLVQVGGPSGVPVPIEQFDRKICYSDLSTGGAFTVFNSKRNFLSILHNFMTFFRDESCGFCVPCRAGNVLLVKKLEKLMKGAGTHSDLAEMLQLGQQIKIASRCGLGQSSPNPITFGIKHFSNSFKKAIPSRESQSEAPGEGDFASEFNLEKAIADSCAVTHRKVSGE